MTETELRARVCAKARSWLGRKEADGGHREIIQVYNTIVPLPRGYRLRYDDPWCAGFVSAVGQALGLTAWIFPECGCAPMVELYRKAGLWMEDDGYFPQPGDLIFYDWQDSGQGDNRGQPDHVGLVVDVQGDLITVCEGNMSDAVGTRTLFRDKRFIRGYGLPDYAAAAAAAPGGEEGQSNPETPEKTETPAEGGRCVVSLPLLRPGDEGEAVWAAQMLLQGRGFPVGSAGCDGEFGPRTQSALRRFQLAKGLACDGILGEESWEKLIGGIK